MVIHIRCILEQNQIITYAAINILLKLSPIWCVTHFSGLFFFFNIQGHTPFQKTLCPSRGWVFFLLHRDCLLTKWTLWSGRNILVGTSITLLFAPFNMDSCSHTLSLSLHILYLVSVLRIPQSWPVLWATPPRIGKLGKKWEKIRNPRLRKKELVNRKRERGGIEREGSVLSQACNGQSHRSRNISCQASRTDRLSIGGLVPCGRLDIDYPRSASDDPPETWSHAKTLLVR